MPLRSLASIRLASLAFRFSISLISLKFHETLIAAIVQVAHAVGLETVALSGGCFQNRYLLQRSVDRLREEGFRPLWHRLIPPNDGGIALGQVVAARRGIVSRLASERRED